MRWHQGFRVIAGAEVSPEVFPLIVDTTDP